jgi:hypothetical protein
MITGTRDSGKCFPHKRFRSSHYGTAGRMLRLKRPNREIVLC